MIMFIIKYFILHFVYTFNHLSNAKQKFQFVLACLANILINIGWGRKTYHCLNFFYGNTVLVILIIKVNLCRD